MACNNVYAELLFFAVQHIGGEKGEGAIVFILWFFYYGEKLKIYFIHPTK